MGELYQPFPKLPKNIRQIGERDQVVKLYLEDYVNTYLKKMCPAAGQDLRVGLLLGSVENHEGTPYVFVDGAIEMEGVTEEGEKVVFTEQAWKKAYQDMEQMFPKRTVQGWFLCGGQGSQLSPLNYWKQHGQYFSGKHQLMYLNSGLEGEEAVYITSEDGFYKLRGHCIYYERNQMMQDYMVLRKDAHRVEAGGNDNVIRDFRKRMDERKSVAQGRRNAVSVLSGLCTALSIAVMAGGVVMFNNYQKMREMESVIASVVPQAAISDAQQKEGVVVDRVEGKVFPTGRQDNEEKAAGGPSGAGSARPAQQTASQPETSEAIGELTAQDAGHTAESESHAIVPSQAAEESREAAATIQPETMAATESAEESPAKAPLEQEAGAGADYRIYQVSEGETLYGICFKLYHNVQNMEEICRINGLEDQNAIKAGQKLLVP